MDFSFTEEQEAFRRMVGGFAKKELAPGYIGRGKQKHYDHDLLRKMAEAGIWGFKYPEKYGGQPADWVTMGIAVEELAKYDLYSGSYVTASTVAGEMLKMAPEHIQDAWFPGMARAEYMGYTGLTEPQCGSDLAAIEVTATKDGKGNYVLNGEKTSITFLDFAKFGMVFAKMSPNAGSKGVGCFFVPKDIPGITISHMPDMGLKPLYRGSIFFDNVIVPEDHCIVSEGKGFATAMKQLDVARSFLGCMCLGLAESSLEDAINFSRDRQAFGKSIASFQGVSFKIAEHYTRIEAAKLLTYKALWLRDQGLPHTKEVAMTKWYTPEICFEAIKDCLVIHGHVGYSEEYPLEQRLRDVLSYQIGDGTANIQKVIIVRDILGAQYGM